MSVKELAESIGKQGSILLSGLRINVTIIDAKQSYGRIRYQVEPISGSGKIFVESIDLEA